MQTLDGRRKPPFLIPGILASMTQFMWLQRTRIWLPPVAVAVATFLVGLAFGAHYPFIISGDGAGYASLVLHPGSSTLYQSGYPLLFSWTGPLAGRAGLPLPLVFRVAQYATYALAVALFHAGAARVAGRIAALVATLLLAFNQMLWVQVQTSRPEWLVAALGIALLGLLMFVVTAPAAGRRRACVLAMGLVFAIGYVVKLNFVCFAPLLALALAWELRLAAPAGRARRTMLAALLLGAAFLAVYVPYMAFHVARTHGVSLAKVTYQQGWTLFDHLSIWKGGVDASDGSASARLVLLAGALPPQDVLPAGQRYEDIGGEEADLAVRLGPEQASVVSELLGGNHDQLLQRIDSRGLRRQLQVEFPPHVLRFSAYHYLGLVRGEQLLVDAFGEAARADPPGFAWNVARTAAAFLQLRADLPVAAVQRPGGVDPTCPLPITGEDYEARQIAACTDVGSPILRLTAAMTPALGLLSVVFWLASAMALVSAFRRGQDSLRAVLIAIPLAFLAQATFAGLVFGWVRSKELVALLPLFLVLPPLAAAWLLREIAPDALRDESNWV